MREVKNRKGTNLIINSFIAEAAISIDNITIIAEVKVKGTLRAAEKQRVLLATCIGII